jgi:hypothetical protein
MPVKTLRGNQQNTASRERSLAYKQSDTGEQHI